jgi:thiol-disulfide isomerase/thioredoxin
MRSAYSFFFAFLVFGNACNLLVHAQEAAAATDEAPVESNDGLENTCEIPKDESADTNGESVKDQPNVETEDTPVQAGPFIDLFGEKLLSLKMVDESHAQMETHLTNEALAGKKVIGVYFSADWCGPCRQFTPELVSFYDKMNKRYGKKDQFEIIWVSRCRDANSFGQYFTHMGSWLALPPEEASGQRGHMLADLFKTKGIPHLVLLDDLGNVITYDARSKIPTDRAGIGFPWRNPLSQMYVTLVPKSFRLMIMSHVDEVKGKVMSLLKKA